MSLQIEMVCIACEIGQNTIPQRVSDGYINATAICKASGKLIFDYSRLIATKEFLKELSRDTGIPISNLVISIKGGEAKLQGTWVHPDIAINLGQWCSPKFAVAVSRWVREWMTGKYKSRVPYHIQRYVANTSEIPPTHFSMLNELTFAFIAPLELAGYTMPDDMVPDISMGIMWNKNLRDELGIDTDSFLKYTHKYADGRKVQAKLYPNELLPECRTYLNEAWIPKHARSYFEKRDPQALVYLSILLRVSSGDSGEGVSRLAS